MVQQPGTRSAASSALAVVLWLASFGLGLQSIYCIKELYILISVQLGGSLRQASSFALGLIYILGLAFLIFIIASTEYHFKHGGKPESWRLFGWTLGVEAAVIILYYIL